MELRQLEYFQMASRLKNITRAAERLRVSQPNITVAIKKLEQELGIQLFDRSQKQLALTAEGTVFLARVDLALRNIQDAVMELNDYKQLQKGTIKIGIPSMIGSYLFPRIFSGFQRSHQHLNIYLYEEGSMAIREKLENDELDFGIVIISGASDNLQLFPITSSQVVACVPPQHLLAQQNCLKISDLAAVNLVMMKEGSYIRHLLMQRLKNEHVQPNVVLESNQIETIKGLVSTEVGLSFLLDFVVRDMPQIKVLPLQPEVRIEIGLAWKKDRYISRAAQSFIDFCRDTMKEGQ